MRKSFYFLAALFAFIAGPLSATTAFAAPAGLTWERGRYQTVEIDTAISPNIAHLDLIGSGKTLTFHSSNVKTNRTTYQISIPNDYPIGNYSVRAIFNDGTILDYANVKVVEYQSQGYNPAADYKKSAGIALTLFTLLTIWAGNRGLDSSSSNSQTTYEGIDANKIAGKLRRKQEYSKGLISSISLDHFRSNSTIKIGKFSPLGSRLMADGGYLQYSLGSLVLFFPALGVALGVLAFHDIHGIGHISTPSLSITASLIALSCLDAGSGFLGFITFSVLAISSHFIANPYDFRTLLGLALLWITPSLMANATRPLRRTFVEIGFWDRGTDLLVGPLFAGWGVKNLVLVLDGFAHLKLPLGSHANACGIAAGAALFIRYLIEDYVNFKNHAYLNYLSPSTVHEQDSNFRILSWFSKAILYTFFAVAFLGIHWELWAVLALFIIPNILKEYKEKFPNSTLLFQVLPAGIPAVIFMTLLNKSYGKWIENQSYNPIEKTQIIFVLLAIPSFLISILKMFGRNAKPDDVRWYVRPKMQVAYKTAGPLLLGLAVALTLGVI